jgi:FkbM family methyltransferase
MKKLISKLIGETNVLYLKKLIPSKSEKIEFKKRKAFYATLINKGELVFDVGANFGNRVAPLLAVGARVVAVEPQNYCANYLQKKFGNKINLVRKGLSSKEEKREFYESNMHTVASFNEEWIKNMKEGRFKETGVEWKKVGEIEMTTLDKLIEKFGIPAFIKIDVEGFEIEVLNGLNKPVKMICFEYAVPDHIKAVKECFERIHQIYGNDMECNYSTGESATWKLNSWISYEKMREHIDTDAFLKTSFGDIYIRSI